MSFHDLKDALLPYTEDQDEATSVLRSRRRPSILVHTGQLPHQHAVHGAAALRCAAWLVAEALGEAIAVESGVPVEGARVLDEALEMAK